MTKRKKILAIASGGGHWVQLLRIRPAFANCEVTYASVRPGYAEDIPGEKFVTVPDATRWDRLKLLWMVLKVAWLVIGFRPDVVISTGAAPGYFAIRFGRLIGARTIWVDSIANVESVSLSGKKIGRYAHLWLTQWPHLTRDDGPYFKGSVL